MEIIAFKVVIDDIIWSIGHGIQEIGTKITEEEYNNILTSLKEKPKDKKGFRWMLRDSTRKWEKHEMPLDDEISDTEALNIIIGGDAE